MTAPPAPWHLFRPHHAPSGSVAFSRDSKRLIAGDQDGYISITDLTSRRVVHYWKAHENGILGVDEWDGRFISHGRDNLIHIYERLPSLRGMSLAGGSRPKETGPAVWKSLPVNSLNFCRFSLATVPRNPKGKAKEVEALLAVPNLVDSELADIYHLPSMKRLHAALNFSDGKMEEGSTRSGLIMSLHLRFVQSAPDLGQDSWMLMLGMGFEDGRVEVWQLPPDPTSAERGERSAEKRSWERFSDGKAAVGPRLWECRYRQKGHNEAVMAMTVNRSCTTAWTVSADHYLCNYDLTQPTSDVKKFSTKHIGNASVALSTDERYLAVGGWDGQIRLFSSSSGKPLGTLEYHRDTVQSLAFPHYPIPPSSPPVDEEVASTEEEQASTAPTEAPEPTVTMEIGASDSEDEEIGEEGGMERLLASGGKDTRVAIWKLKDFGG